MMGGMPMLLPSLRPAESRHDLLSIGAFSRRTRLPVSTLRYYHERGLLEPLYVDPATGYRYYGQHQLATAWLVAELRGAGMGLDAIAAVTRGRVALTEALRSERQRIESEVRHRTRALATIDRLLADGIAPATPLGVGVIMTLPARSVPSVDGLVRTEAAEHDVRRLLVRLRRQLRLLGETTGTYGAVFPLDLATDPVPTTVFASVDAHRVPGLSSTSLPGGSYAVIGHTCGGELGPSYDALIEWATGNGRDPIGPVIEEYGASAVRISIGLAE
jgi:DNA-binding transcriptional MerR regulator